MSTNSKFNFGKANDKIKDLNYSNAAAHNAIYRGKCLGTSAAGTSPVTQEQWNQIKAGTFEDMYIGDYWQVGNNQYTICHFDYYYRSSDSDITAHHIVLMPRETIKDLSYTAGTSSRGSDNPSGGSACWNLTDSTAGGYIGSHIRTVVMPACDNRVKADFGSNHILTISELYPNSFASSTDGRANGWAWTSTDYACDLPNETMVYGSQVWGLGNNNTSPYWEVGIDKYQLAIMGLDESFVHNRGFYWWLRSVSSASYVAYVSDNGGASYGAAACSLGVRPRFCIYSA